MLTLREHLKTPTFALTTSALSLLLLGSLTGRRAGELAAVPFLLAGAGGCAMALSSECTRKGETWCWTGLYKALYHPSRDFYWGFFSHLPALLVGYWLALRWFARTQTEQPR